MFGTGSFQLNDIEPTTLDQRPTKRENADKATRRRGVGEREHTIHWKVQFFSLRLSNHQMLDFNTKLTFQQHTKKCVLWNQKKNQLIRVHILMHKSFQTWNLKGILQHNTNAHEQKKIPAMKTSKLSIGWNAMTKKYMNDWLSLSWAWRASSANIVSFFCAIRNAFFTPSFRPDDTKNRFGIESRKF